MTIEPVNKNPNPAVEEKLKRERERGKQCRISVSRFKMSPILAILYICT